MQKQRRVFFLEATKQAELDHLAVHICAHCRKKSCLPCHWRHERSAVQSRNDERRRHPEETHEGLDMGCKSLQNHSPRRPRQHYYMY